MHSNNESKYQMHQRTFHRSKWSYVSFCGSKLSSQSHAASINNALAKRSLAASLLALNWLYVFNRRHHSAASSSGVPRKWVGSNARSSAMFLKFSWSALSPSAPRSKLICKGWIGFIGATIIGSCITSCSSSSSSSCCSCLAAASSEPLFKDAGWFKITLDGGVAKW